MNDMKKNYISPDTIEIKIRGSYLLTASDPNVTLNGGDSVEAGSVESRRYRYDAWDDEEDW